MDFRFFWTLTYQPRFQSFFPTKLPYRAFLRLKIELFKYFPRCTRNIALAHRLHLIKIFKYSVSNERETMYAFPILCSTKFDWEIESEFFEPLHRWNTWWTLLQVCPLEVIFYVIFSSRLYEYVDIYFIKWQRYQSCFSLLFYTKQIAKDTFHDIRPNEILHNRARRCTASFCFWSTRRRRGW